ncbi:50S ribosomal protein L14e [Candidatus Woesearchaeota archaeon]|nr:50S ribosomal protein L14e [Candidatus Woesearchaeota archaeon]
MSIFEVGRLCVKIAGRDAGRTCVVVEAAGNGYVVVDGDVRRKKVNIKHLEPLDRTVEVKSKAAPADVKKAFEKAGLPVWETKPKKAAERQRKQKAKKEAPVSEKKAAKPKKVKQTEEALETPVEA